MTQPWIRRFSAALGALALALTTATVGAAPAQADTNCYTATDNGDTWYRGDSASYRYDYRFSGGPNVSPYVLDHRIPQGMTTWHNWRADGSTTDLLLYTAYRGGSQTWIQGINPRNGHRTKIIRVAGSHAGGIAIVGRWLYVSGPGSNSSATVRQYRLRDIRAALKSSTRSPYVRSVRTRDVYGNAFLASRSGNLFAGRFNKDGRSWMKRYDVTQRSGALRATKTYRVPKKTQGLVVTGGHFVFSTSWTSENRSNIYIVKRGSSLDSSGTSCFRAPSMSEGLARWGGKIYVIYESGSYKYRTDSCNWWHEPNCTRNIITRLHKVPFSSLTSLVD